MKIFAGNFVHATDKEPMVILTNAVIGVSDSKIVFVKSLDALDQVKATYNVADSDVIILKESQFMIPGFIDTHIHAPQFPNNGLKLDLPLLEWLENYTYRTEAKFVDENYARKIYPKVVDRLLRNGTTTACYFATLHTPSTKILADIVKERGQRALVGKCSIMLHWPQYYRAPPLQESLRQDEDFICYVRSLKSPLIHPVLAPRFPPTYTIDEMKAVGELARKYDCYIQSHLSETRPECDYIRESYPWSKNYTDVYDQIRLLGPKTILGHGNWLQEEELKRLRETGTSVAHCPNSNISIRSGLCDVRRLLEHGVKVGLGTDCSAGYSTSLLDGIRQALQTSKTHSILKEGYKHLSLYEVFRLVTLGGAQVVSMKDKIGNFEVGKEFDALLIDLEVEDSPVDLEDEDSLEDKFQRFLLNGDDRNIVQVFVAGAKVHQRSN